MSGRLFEGICGYLEWLLAQSAPPLQTDRKDLYKHSDQSVYDRC